ncbi:hypothetical protein lpa_02158 [Legionella pneumophila 2300/99 Alcoy]|nr:hypothetical protein lpa_02158 [Legionella pneumophila 2300/99 Alcoy]
MIVKQFLVCKNSFHLEKPLWSKSMALFAVNHPHIGLNDDYASFL